MGRERVALHFFALLGYFTLALLATYPTVLYFTTRVTGNSLLADRNQHLWNLWWIRQALVSTTNPFHTDMLYYPYGVDLYYHALGLSHGLIGLLPLLLWGLPAAYNTAVLAAFTLAGYGAFRLALLITGKLLPSFLGGVVFAFTPYMLDALDKGQTEVLSVQWIPFYAEAWLRATRTGKVKYMLIAGMFFALAAYGSLYYAVYLLLFTLAHVTYSIFATPEKKAVFRSVLKAGATVGIVGLIFILPLVIGLIADYKDPRLEVLAGESHMLGHSADLLSLFAPPHDHPLLSGITGGDTSALRDYVTLGYIALGLALLGGVVRWRRREGRFWALLALIALVLAMGPQLQIGNVVTGIPMPFKLVEGLPGVSAIGKVSRFLVLTRLCMAVLSAWGAAWLIARLGRHLNRQVKTALPFAALLALIIVELPLYPRDIQPLQIPPSIISLAEQRDGKAIMELPFARRQVEPLGERMLYQTTHNHPLLAGYLSRTYNNPITGSCSPFWGFISPLDVPPPGTDVITPAVTSRLMDVLQFYKIGYVALYNTYGGARTEAVAPREKMALQQAISRVSHTPPLSSDKDVSIYKVDDEGNIDSNPASPSLHVGSGWYGIEQVAGAPFRWVKDSEATLCVFTTHRVTARLIFEGTAFAHKQSARIYEGDSANGSGYVDEVFPQADFVKVSIGPKEWQPGVTEVHFRRDNMGTTPESLDPQSQDDRPLTVGIRGVHLELGGKK